MTLEEIFEAKKDETVWVILVYRESIVLGRRSDSVNNPGQWNFFGGHIDAGETSKDAAIRELREETGFKLSADQLRQVDYINGATYFVAYISDMSKVKRSRETAKIMAFKQDDLPEKLHSKTAQYFERNNSPL